MTPEWVVWVGGIEINDNYLPEDEANRLAEFYKEIGYDDVYVERHAAGATG